MSIFPASDGYFNCSNRAVDVTTSVVIPYLCSAIRTQNSIKYQYGCATAFFIFRPYFIWERKIFKSNGFFLQNLPRIIVYVIWRSTFTEFNWHKFSSMRYVFVKIFGLFWEWRKWPHNDPKMTPKMTKIQNFPNFHRFHAFFAIFLINIVN